MSHFLIDVVDRFCGIGSVLQVIIRTTTLFSIMVFFSFFYGDGGSVILHLVEYHLLL